jgi:hypothetical protein
MYFQHRYRRNIETRLYGGLEVDGTGALSCPVATFDTRGVIQLIGNHNRSKNTLYHQSEPNSQHVITHALQKRNFGNKLDN